MTQKTLAVELSRLKTFKNASTKLEQYSTDSDVAAELIWSANNLNLIKNKKIIDLGAGTGILGIGCLLMGAKQVVFLEKDEAAIKILEENLSKIKKEYEITGKIQILHDDVQTCQEEADLVIQNPPFGTKNKNMDTIFLEAAMRAAPHIITMHKESTDKYIQNFINENKYKILRKYSFKYPLKKTMPQHKQKIEYINVSGWLLERNN